MKYQYAEETQQQSDTSTKSDQKYFLTLDPRQVLSKPTEEEKKYITQNLTLVQDLTIEEFREIITPPNSMTWIGGIFSGTRKNAKWLRQSVFGVDFDKGILSIEEAIKRIQQFNITPQLWYTSFSDSPQKRKFRLVFFLESPVEDIRLHKLIATGLVKLYPESDQKCDDQSRMFFGGKECLILHHNPISNAALIDAMSIFTATSDSNSFRKLPLSSSYFTSMKSAEKQTSLYNIYRSSHISAESPPPPTSMTGRLQQGIDLSIAKQKVRILREFTEGRWLSHMELFGLATNLLYIIGGMKLMKDTMNKFNGEGKTQYTENNFNIMTYVNKTKYHSMQLLQFSPFEEDHQYHNIISAVKETRGEIEIIEPIHKIELNEAEQLMKDSYRDVIENGTSGQIYLFNLPTALGKTESIISTEGITLSLPTHKLKNEIAQRMKVKHITTPDQIVFENQSLNQKLIYYYTIGLPKKATAALYDILKPQNSKKYNQSDIVKAEKYLSQLNGSLASTDTILTTHSRALHTDFKHNTLIFDEDPLNQLIEIKQLDLMDLVKLSLSATNLYKDDLDLVIEYLKGCNRGEIINTPTFDINVDELINKLSTTKIESNVFEFFRSSYFIRDIRNAACFHYVVRREVPEGKKVLIMSATIPIYIYKQLFGSRINNLDVRDVKQQGSVIQYTDRSCSRNSLNRYHSQMSDKVGNKPVITFKAFARQFQNPTENIHFGNCAGYDSLKGQDIAIVGTPHRNNIEYLLTAKVCGIDFKTTDTTMMYQKIEYNGFRFKFNCYEHEELRNLQLSLIESDLIQAVGRARTLRTDANVEVYSNFPLRISDEYRY